MWFNFWVTSSLGPKYAADTGSRPLSIQHWDSGATPTKDSFTRGLCELNDVSGVSDSATTKWKAWKRGTYSSRRGKGTAAAASLLLTAASVRLTAAARAAFSPSPHIAELPVDIPKPVIQRLKSIMGLVSQDQIDSWHEFCAAQTEPAIKTNPWILPSINKFLSKISQDNWDITPYHSNYVDTAHASRNTETAVGVALLTGILQQNGRLDYLAAPTPHSGSGSVPDFSESEGHGTADGTIMFNRSGLMLSQELPRLPPPSIPSRTTIEPEDPVIASDPVAP
ncbi:hypothetical protein DFH08DRAFT_827862 [Mycena albidolilacea]|uniref:Uncharacterized protein n=1 Tax=Mycena albidolilacea TaxID=1033008 RepID=A0AAD6YYA8_9AGAR|nr:hypothetical protein DFH08DRAFT_827862 [Mycena albidolilacea]